MKGLNKKEKKVLRRIIVSAALLLIVKLLPELPFPVWPLSSAKSFSFIARPPA